MSDADDITVHGEPLSEWRTCPWWPNGTAARINAGYAGHDREIVLVIDRYGYDDMIPDPVFAAVAAVLPDSWHVENRGTRIEIHPTGRFAGGFTADDVHTVARAVPQIGVHVERVDIA